MDIAITGSSGFIGNAVVNALEARGDRVIRLVRTVAFGRSDAIGWDPNTGDIDSSGLAGVDAVIHLCGEPIANKRWSPAHKVRVRESRTVSTLLLAETLAALDRPPSTLVSSSAIGYYGTDTGDAWMDENDPPGAGFLAELCAAWEAATRPAERAGVRVVHARTGLVLGREGGLLPRVLAVFKGGLGGRIASGEQFWSWITLADEVGAILHLLDSADVSGPVNMCAPAPVTNREFTKTLAAELHRPAFLPVPAAGLKLVFGSEMATEMFTSGIRARPRVLVESGYDFADPELAAALEGLLTPS